MKNDCVKYNIFFFFKFGVVEIICQCVCFEMDINIFEICLMCNGIGEVQVFIFFVEEIEGNLNYLFQECGEKKVILEVYLYLEVYFKCGILLCQRKWFLKYKKWIDVQGVILYYFLEYFFKDGNNNEIVF